MLTAAGEAVDTIGTVGVVFGALLALFGVVAASAKFIAFGYRIARIIESELTHNGGSSVKDHAKQTADDVSEMKDQMAELRSAQKTTSIVLDRIIERKALDHQEMWDTLAAHGIDRRVHDDRRPPADPGNGAT